MSQFTREIWPLILPVKRRLRYEGFCAKCNKLMPHRYLGGSLYSDDYECWLLEEAFQ